MCGLGDIEEVLWVAAPELVFLAVLSHSFATSSLSTPFALELLLYSSWKLDYIDLLRGKDAQEEGSFLLFLVLDLSVRHYDVVDILLVVLGVQPYSPGNFPLFEPLTTLCGLKNDVILVDFPESVSLGFHPYHRKVDRNVWSLRDVLILLHKRDNHLSALSNGEAVLWVVEPAVVGVKLHIGVFVLFISVSLHRVGTTCGVSSPLSGNRKLAPSGREDFAEIHLIEVNAPVFVAHPPGAVITEDVVKLLFQTLIVVPSLVLICELASPLSLTPRVADPHELKAVNITDVKDTIGVIEENAGLASSLRLVSAIVLHDIGAADQETLLMVLLEVLPEDLVLDLLGNLGCSEVEFLRRPTGKVDKRLGHTSTIDGLVGPMELSISLLN